MSKAAKEAKRAYMKKWREENRERYNEYMRQWKAENPDKVAEYDARHWEKKARGE